MTERRPFPPSPRRLALARQAGLTAASPLLVGALACAAAVIAAVMLARAAASLVGSWIAAACRAAAVDARAVDNARGAGAGDALGAATAADALGAAVAGDALGAAGAGDALGAAAAGDALGAAAAGDALGAAGAGDTLGAAGANDPSGALDVLAPSSVSAAVLELALPLVAAIAIVALIAHVAQTRALWLPRRRHIPGAPALPRARVRDAALEVSSAIVIGAVAFGWLWTTAPRLAALFALEPTFDRMLVAVGSALASFVVALAIAWLVIAVLDALVRRVDLAHALAMTITEKREDDRLAAADPRWRAQRLAVLRGPWSSRSVARGPSASSAVARSALVLLGDDTAVAIAWDARRQPVPVRTITGRGARATQLLGLARRHRIAVHRDAALAAALVDGDGPVPDTHWARLATILAAVQAANTGRDLSA